MAYSQKQIQDRALRLATMTGTDPHQSPVIDNSVVIEDKFYSALKQSVLIGANDPSEVGGLKRDHTITLTNGVGPMPDTVLDECLDDSSVYSTTDDQIAQFSSYQPRYNDYLRPGQSQLAYYAVQGQSFLFRDVGADAGVFDGDVHLVAISTPAIPAVITDSITIATATAERCILLLSNLLKGANEP